MDEEGWELLEDLKEDISQISTSLKMIAEIMLYELKKKHGNHVDTQIYKKL